MTRRCGRSSATCSKLGKEWLNWDTYIRDVDVRDVPGVGKVEFSSLADKEWYDPKTGEHVIYNGGDGGFDPQELGMTGLVSRDEYPRAQ